MAIFKPTYPKPLPAGAELFTKAGERWARWTDGRGRKRTAKVSVDGRKVLIESRTWHAKYRTAAGPVRTVPTGCRQREAAAQVLADLERRAERVRAGIASPAEAAAADAAGTPLAGHVAAYLEYLSTKPGKGGRPRMNAQHLSDTRHRVGRVFADCGFKTLRELNRAAVERWAADREAEPDGMSAGTLNGHLRAVTSFGNWAVSTGRLAVNPLARLPHRDEAGNRRRPRRALTADELGRLLKVAQLRPLADFGREVVRADGADDRDNKRSRKTWTRAPLTIETIDAAAERGGVALSKRPELVAQLERRGRERGLLYKTLVLTGLRKSELAALTVAGLELNGPRPFLVLPGHATKSGKRAETPIRADLADDLRSWLADALFDARSAARAAGKPLPARLPGNAQVFNVPTGLIRILDRDIAAAGIPKVDDRGRHVDVHALRHSFGTHLSAGGVAPRVAQELMRHSSIDLTMNTYTDAKLLDLHGALLALPALELGTGAEADRAAATGTDDAVELSRAQHAPKHAPTFKKACQKRGTPDKTAKNRRNTQVAVSGCQSKDLHGMALTGKLGRVGVEPTTHGFSVRKPCPQVEQKQALASDSSAACTKSADSGADTNENRGTAPAGGELQGDALADALALVARLPGLTDAERAEAVRRLLKGGNS